MKTKYKNYFLHNNNYMQIVLAKNISEVRKNFPGASVFYSGPLTKNELFFKDRIFGKEIAPGVYENRLYL